MKRTYVIKIKTNKNKTLYVSVLRKYDIGYTFEITGDINKAKKWKNKKSIDKIVKKFNSGLFQPGFNKYLLSLYSYEVMENTPKKTLRLLKLKKLLKKVNS